MARMAVVIVFILLAVVAVESAIFEFVHVDNEQQDFATRGWLEEDSLFQQNVRVAGELWAAELDLPLRRHLQGTPILVRVAPRSDGRATGTFFPGRRVATFTSSGHNLFQQSPKSSDLVVVEPAARQVILTGSSPFNSDVDILIQLDVNYMDRSIWFDPTPQNRTDELVPVGRVDFTTVFLHELGHGLGMAGFRTAPTNDGDTLPDGFASLFDSLSYFDNEGADDGGGGRAPLFFHGPISMGLNCGNPIPLSHFDEGHLFESQNFYHVGSDNSVCFAKHSSDQTGMMIRQSLMRSCPTPIDGSRLSISHLDRAILADMGYPLKTTTTQELHQDVLDHCPTAAARPAKKTSSLCPPSPQSFCENAAKAKLVIRSKRGGTRQSLKWRFRGDGNRRKESASALGLPTVGTDYALCLYKDSKAVQELSIAADAQRWNQTHAGHFLYQQSRPHNHNNNATTEMTVRRLSLRAGTSRDKLRSVKVGLQTHDSLPTTVWTMPTEFQIGITVQLIHNIPYSDTCFGATLSNAAVQTNTAQRFVAQFQE